ncbi:MAG: hypothetical protein JWN46_2264 [Acidimicrobiales bacterium]|nr:hypothetical protein [Acidimicrobiales bacterium]
MSTVSGIAESTRLRLEEWLGGALATPLSVTSVAIPKQGYSNETWFVEAVDDEHERPRSLVIRVQPATSRLFPSTDVLHQWRVMSALADTGVPLPPLVAAEPDTSVLGTAFFVMEHVTGRIPPDLPPYNVGGWVVDLAPDERRTVWERGLEALARVHAVPLSRVRFLEDLGPGGAGLDQYLHWVEGWYRWASEGRDLPLLDRAMAALRSRMPADASVGLAWGDARPGNIIYGPDLDVVAILDWEMAALGPPEMDLAWWLFADRFYSEGFAVPPLDGLPTPAESVAVYEDASGCKAQDLDYYGLLAAFRMAIVIVRSTTDHLSSGLLSPDTTMDSANPATRIVAELLGEPIPDLSPEFAKVIEARTRT